MEYIIIGVVFIVLLCIYGVSVYIASNIFKSKKWEYLKAYESELSNGNFDDNYLSKFHLEEVYMEHDGLKLHAQLINNKSDKTIIFMHGHNFALFGSYKYTQIFLELGFNVLMPDERYHGLSEGEYTTLSYKEATDLEAWTNYILKKIPTTKVLGYHGESMGAATVLSNGHNEHVDFIISDCAFSSLKKQTMDILWRRHRIPPVFVYTANLVSSLQYKIPLFKIRPVDNVKNIKSPILFVHGDSDSYIGLDHMERLMKEAKECDSYIAKNADHACSILVDKEKYKEVVLDFLRGRNII